MTVKRNAPSTTSKKNKPHWLLDSSGNVFFTLFGAVAIVGLLGTVIVSTMRGPLTTMVEVQARTQAESEMNIASRLALLEATEQTDDGDCDGDGFVEPLEFKDAAGDGPNGGGFLPDVIASARIDPWGTEYGYCSWDAGPTTNAIGCDTDGSGTNERLDGNSSSTDETYTVIAIVSAGSDQVFDTSCDGGAYPSATRGGDDLLVEFTYATARTETDGLWTIKEGDATTAEISKNLEVTGGASFSAGIDLTASSSALQLGAASMLYPDETTLTTCNAANAGLIRIYKADNPDYLQLCDETDGWVSIGGGLWTAGAGDDIYYDTGTYQVGIGTSTPSEALDVIGNIALSGDLLGSGTIEGDSLDINNNASIGGTLDVTGTTNLGVLNTSGATDLGSTLDVSGSTTLSSTLGVTGTSNLSDVNASGAVDLDSTLNVDGSATFTSSVEIQGDITNSTGNVIVRDRLVVSDQLDVRGSVMNYGGSVVVNDTLDLNGSMDVSGSIDVSQNIDVDGTLEADDYTWQGNDFTPETCSSGQYSWWDGNSWECGTDDDGSTGSGPGNTTAGVFEVDETTDPDVVRMKSTVGTGYADVDFIFGAPTLDYDSNTDHAARMFFDKSKGAFRAGSASSAQWDDSNVGTSSVALGLDTIASGANSLALGQDVQATGTSSVAIGLGTSSGQRIVSGNNSFGIFMGDQGYRDLSGANRFALFGGDFLIDSDATQGSQGCIRYNEVDDLLEYSDDCTNFYSFTNDIQGLWTDLGDGRIYRGTDSSSFVGVGTSNPITTLDVKGGVRIGSTTGSIPTFINLNDLGDVSADTPTDGDCIIYNDASGDWENSSCAGASSKWQDGATSGEIYYNSGNVGVGTADPTVALDVNGTIRIADGNETCDGTIAGAIRYRADVLQFCDGTSWLNVASATGGVVLQLDKLVQAGMDIDGSTCGVPPCYTATTTFVLSNVGSDTSEVLSVFDFTGNTSNFEITSNTCTGIALDGGDSCSIVVRAVASGNGSYSAKMEIAHNNIPSFNLSGEATGFGCSPGVFGWGGIVVQCDYAGSGLHLVIDEGGCDGTTSEPTCTGTDAGVNLAWATGTYATTLLGSTTDSDGDQNHVNILAYANGSAGAFPAAQYCENLIHNSETDWFIPSTSELTAAHNISLLTSGGLSSYEYYTGSGVYRIESDGDQSVLTKTSAGMGVRCMRIEGVALPAAQSDTTPETITFSTKFASTSGVTTTSDSAEVIGITPGVSISVSGSTAEYSINGGAFTSAAGTIDPFDTVQLRIDSGSVGNNVSATLTIGTSSFTYSVITLPDCGGAGCSGIDKRVFVSADSSISASAPISTLDSNCQTYADTAGLGGTWMSISSGSANSEWAINRIDYNWDRLVNMNGDVIATSAQDLWDGSISNTINYEEDGTYTASGNVRTNSYEDGSYRSAGYGSANQTDGDWINVGTSGVFARVYCLEVSEADITLTASPSSIANMNVVAPGSPALGTEETITIENTGTSTSGVLSTSIINSTNFTITTDNCSGNTLAAAATCTMGVTPQAYADGNYYGTLTVSDTTNSVSVSIGLSGVSSGFGLSADGKWTDGDDTGDIYYNDGPVGIGTTDPDVALHVDGTILIADGGEACASATAGAIRYYSNSVQFCDGTNWRHMASDSTTVSLSFSPVVQTNMDVDGTCGNASCSGTSVQFVLTNNGTSTSSAVAWSLSGDTANFSTLTDNCTGVTLASGASCTIDVEPQATGNGTFNGRIEVSTDNQPAAILQGDATGFSCAPGISGGGGIYVACGTYDTVITETDIASSSWGSYGISRSNLTDSNGPQNTVNLIAYGGGMHPAAELCDNLVEGGYDDWYLPAIDELLLVNNSAIITAAGLNTGSYWTSSQQNSNEGRRLFNYASSNSGKNSIFNVRCFRRDGQAMPSAQSDITPDSFDFTDNVTSQTTRLSSNTITVENINAAANISIGGANGTPQYSINGGSMTDASGTVSAGDTVTISMIPPPDAQTSYTATLTIGGVSDTWTVSQSTGGGACNQTDVFTVDGTYSYEVPSDFDNITIEMWGGGGGGGGATSSGGTDGDPGTDSSIAFLGLNAGGGAAGASGSTGAVGAGGTASGGDTNINGNAGSGRLGGDAPGTGGGNGGTTASPYHGDSPGGGGGGASHSGRDGGGGGSGAYVSKSYTTGTLTAGSTLTNIIVGAGGAGGDSTSDGGDGGTGRVQITCTEAGAPPASGATFTASLDDTPTDYTGAANQVVKVNNAGDGVEFGGTGAVILPAGGTSDQPTGVNGMMRYNTDTNRFEVYENSAWVDLGSAVSDVRLKTNIEPLNASMIDRLDLINTYSYQMTNDKTQTLQYGVLAQELEKIFPELVKQPTQEGTMKSVNYIGLIAPLIEATKGLKAQNEDLRAELSALKAHQVAQTEQLEKLATNVETLNKMVGNDVNKASMSWIIALLIGLFFGGGLVVMIHRQKQHE